MSLQIDKAQKPISPVVSTEPQLKPEKRIWMIEAWLLERGTFTEKMARKNGLQALDTYLKTSQTYLIATESISLFIPFSILPKGALGHHAFIKLPGERICELGITDDAWKNKVKRITDMEVRYAPGKEIEMMWRKHCELIQKYRKWTDGKGVEGWKHYRPFKNDCFHYVDRVLISSNQTPTTLHRLNQTALGIQVEKLLVPDDRKGSSSSCKKDKT